VSAPRVRLFVALDLPVTVRDRLAEWARAELSERAGARPLAAESLHVTLCFLGGRDAGEVEAIAAACAVVGDRGVVALQVGTPLWLPPRRPRVAAVTLIDPEDALLALQSTLAQALSDGGWYQRERRPFLAHVTVARIARGGPARPPAMGSPAAQRFSAASVSLYRSHTGPRGASYEPLATIAL
jgi:RNA 2',3'-cyclic 3'-phosphodiesterase